jgi:hypothetical protein
MHATAAAASTIAERVRPAFGIVMLSAFIGLILTHPVTAAAYRIAWLS